MRYFACWLSQFCYTWIAFPSSILTGLCVLYVYVHIFMYICIYVYTYIVVFGILMEFVLYATIIAGTKTPTQHFSLCGHRDDRYVFFILCPWTPLLFFICDKGLHPAVHSTADTADSSTSAIAGFVADPTNQSLGWLSTSPHMRGKDSLWDQIDTEKKNGTHKETTNYITTLYWTI